MKGSRFFKLIIAALALGAAALAQYTPPPFLPFRPPLPAPIVDLVCEESLTLHIKGWASYYQYINGIPFLSSKPVDIDTGVPCKNEGDVSATGTIPNLLKAINKLKPRDSGYRFV